VRALPPDEPQFFPTWQTDVAAYDPGTPGSGKALVNQLKLDLKDYVQTAVADRSIRNG
jgi:hypothetical protein